MGRSKGPSLNGNVPITIGEKYVPHITSLVSPQPKNGGGLLKHATLRKRGQNHTSPEKSPMQLLGEKLWANKKNQQSTPSQNRGFVSGRDREKAQKGEGEKALGCNPEQHVSYIEGKNN